VPSPETPASPLASVLADWRREIAAGDIADSLRFGPGLALYADPSLEVRGTWRSPAGRLLELDVTTSGTGTWIGLHVTLDAPDLTNTAWIGFACRSVAPEQATIRCCLRSGTDEGFTDCFFDRHILSDPEPRSHVDALHIPTTRAIPETAIWRELVLFLPRKSFRWHLHDLRPFLP